MSARSLSSCLALGIWWFLASGLSAAPAEESAASDGIWITVGADAFDVLAHSDIQFRGKALQAEAATDAVVLTRVSPDQLRRISLEMHEDFHRCPGFMAHSSRSDGLRAMNAATNPTKRGTVSYEINQGALVQDLEARIEKANILATMEHLSTEYNNRYYQHPSGVASATWIRDTWQSLAAARPDVTSEFYDHPSWPQPSVVLTIPGTTHADEVIVLGGHQDSIASGSSNPNFSAPGADDNASGISVLTEVIRVAMEGNFRPQRTVRFMAYAAEEVGLLGSQAIAGDYQSSGIDVVAVLQLDMTNYQGSVQDMAFLSDFTNNDLTTFAKSLIDTYQPELEWTNTACGYACSDHASWHNEGYPAVMPSEAIFGQHNPWLHTTSDTVGTLGDNADHAYKFARLATALMVEIGMLDSGQFFFDGFETGDTSGWD